MPAVRAPIPSVICGAGTVPRLAIIKLKADGGGGARIDTEGFSIVVTIHAQTVCPSRGVNHKSMCARRMLRFLDSSAFFQANNDFRVLGESMAGMYAYQFWSWPMPFVGEPLMTALSGTPVSRKSRRTSSRLSWVVPAGSSECIQRVLSHADHSLVKDLYCLWSTCQCTAVFCWLAS